MYIGAFMSPLYHLSSFLHKWSLEVALGRMPIERTTRRGKTGAKPVDMSVFYWTIMDNQNL
jgi:hypothetical protein